MDKVKEGMGISLEQQLQEDTNLLYKKLLKIIIIISLTEISFLLLCFSQLLTNGFKIIPERMMIASAGMLTFISIYYALIITGEGIKIFKKIDELIKEKEEHLRLLAKERIEKSRDSDGMLKANAKTKKDLENIKTIKIWMDVEYMLLSAVICLIISIIFNISNVEIINFVGFIFFSIGVGFCGIIVVEWRLLRKIFKEYL